MSDEEPRHDVIDLSDNEFNDNGEAQSHISVLKVFGIPLVLYDFQNHLMPDTPLNMQIIDAAVSCYMHTYILEDRRDRNLCMAFTSCFLQVFNRRTPIPRSRARLITFTSNLTLPLNESPSKKLPANASASDQLQQAPIEKLSLVVFPLIVDSYHWALLVFCFHRKKCFYFDERIGRDIQLQPAHGAFFAITVFFKELWNVEPGSWSFVDVAPPPPHEDVWGPHVHCAQSCGVNVLQVIHRLLRNFRRTPDPASLEMAYPPICLCASYRTVIDETLRNGGVPVAYVGLNLT
jgi:hypothetical protein